ncbi:DUF1178 domain-containing protein [Roseobacter denitrificans]|uniref:DUF1178 family protein n=1 Tax=Roseobacter denitrificans (strain ATCC 33942 / OCh 114) TaxID=375451 RepID=Q167U2_ROSDO|nr:DUF1178 family protein [Roseobacter denitrificans]ABG31751.1 conserved hypothetical protein [Roseobacter denitrificans OCh 114]AVL51330.1 DUF1178 domain-containing protein [Roseobacter denitrificans]SFF87423.1 hypothetical protein SAMN05443635_10384 [Roseobacter denitrificans OCh 114]
MIQYALKCDEGHQFESWFQSASAFDALAKSGHLSCAVCGSTDVAKAIMSPRVSSNADAPKVPALTSEQSDSEKALAALRKHVEDNADYVGSNFAQEARSMYLGATPERAIYGEANGTEAKALIEDGVPVAPLPFLPNRKAN